MKLKLLLIIACLSFHLLNAQSPGQAVQFVNVLTGGSTLPYTSPYIANFGQLYHAITFIARNSPAHTCTTPGLIGWLEGSQDQTSPPVNFFRIALAASGFTVSVSQGAGLPISYTVSGIGSYPYLRVQVVAFDNTNCVLDVNYAGNATSATGPNQPIATRSGFCYLTRNCGGTLTGGTTDLCAGGGTGTKTLVWLSNPYPGHGADSSKLVLYGVLLSNYSAGNETVTIAGGITSCSVIDTDVLVDHFTLGAGIGGAVGGVLMLPQNTLAYYVTSSTALCVLLGANASTHNLEMRLLYRIE